MRARQWKRRPSPEGDISRQSPMHVITGMAHEELLRPPFSPAIAARDLRARATSGANVTISAAYAAEIADALDAKDRR